MTHTSTDQDRAEFEARFKHLDLTREPDAWGAPRYKHDAISLACLQAARRAQLAWAVTINALGGVALRATSAAALDTLEI